MYKPKILVLGYYGRSNFGDECFKEAFTEIFDSFDLSFKDLDTVQDMSKKDLSEYERVIVGGGDLINEYFYTSVAYLRENYHDFILGFSIGFPFTDYKNFNFLSNFDYIFTRTRSALSKSQLVIGSSNVSHCYDAVFSLIDRVPNIIPERSDSLAVCVPHEYSSNHNYTYQLAKLIDKISKTNRKIVFIPFDTNNKGYNDVDFAKNISEMVCGCEIFIDEEERCFDDMLRYISTFSQVLCGRYHSAVICMMTNTPFITIHKTEKINDLMKEAGLEKYSFYHDSSKCMKNYSDDCYEGLEKLHCCEEENVIDIYKYYCQVAKNYYNFDKCQNVLQRGRIRRHVPNKLMAMKPSMVIKSLFKYVKDNLDIDLSQGGHYLNQKQASIIADRICFICTRKIHSKYNYGAETNLQNKEITSKILYEMVKWILIDRSRCIADNAAPINLELFDQSDNSNVHRAGWQSVMSCMKILNDPNGPIMDCYVDRTFTWAKNTAVFEGLIPYTSPWYGFIHHGVAKVCSNNVNIMFSCPEFKMSLRYCKGLFVLSNWLKKKIEEYLIESSFNFVKVFMIHHPTPHCSKTFQIKNIKKNEDINLVMVGAWLRNTFTIYSTELGSNIKKFQLLGPNMGNYVCPENFEICGHELFNEDMTPTNKNRYDDNLWVNYLSTYVRDNLKLILSDKFEMTRNFVIKWGNEECLYPHENHIHDSELSLYLLDWLTEKKGKVEILNRLSNEEYDELLSKSVVFVHYEELSASNTLIECIMRNTPILINDTESAREYLGDEYPMYWSAYEDIPKLLTREKIFETYMYISGMDKMHLDMTNFVTKLSGIINKNENYTELDYFVDE